MESFENQNIWSEPTQREQILSTARIIEIFKQDNDFEEYASLNSLSKKLEWLSEDQFNLCKRFIEREYNKINISKEQRGDYVDHYYLRHFLSHDILSRFKEEKEKLTLVLQFLLKHENIDLCRQKNFYDNEVKVIKALWEMSENQIWSILALSQESVKNFTNIIKFNPQITESLIQNINTFTDEQIIYLTKIISLSHWDETVSISIFWLLFLNQKINLKIKEIFNLYNHSSYMTYIMNLKKLI